jgi:hypothetical protein
MNSGQHPTKHETGKGVAVAEEEIVVRKYYPRIAASVSIAEANIFTCPWVQVRDGGGFGKYRRRLG